MTEELSNRDAGTPRQRAARARRRAEEARARISELRSRRLGAKITSGRQDEDLRLALAHAKEAHDQLLLALEASALAHERAGARYIEQAKGDVRLEAMARRHLAAAEADRERVRRLKSP